MAKIVWLASYPKSGNTWMRTFLWALQNRGPINLNRLNTGGIFSSKNMIESILDLNPDLLHAHEIEEYQRIAYTHHFETATENKFIKIHDAYTFSTWSGRPLIPLSPDHLVINIVRNPIDVIPSFANHSSLDCEDIIKKQINSPKGGLVRSATWGSQFHQPMGTWSMHVESWQNQTIAPMLTIRYEDMLLNTFETFKKVVNQAELPYSDEQVQETIQRTTFDKIKKLEQQQGFREKMNPESSFFKYGKIGRGQEMLTLEQIERVRSVNEKMMKKLNYW